MWGNEDGREGAAEGRSERGAVALAVVLVPPPFIARLRVAAECLQSTMRWLLGPALAVPRAGTTQPTTVAQPPASPDAFSPPPLYARWRSARARHPCQEDGASSGTKGGRARYPHGPSLPADPTHPGCGKRPASCGRPTPGPCGTAPAIHKNIVVLRALRSRG